MFVLGEGNRSLSEIRPKVFCVGSKEPSQAQDEGFKVLRFRGYRLGVRTECSKPYKVYRDHSNKSTYRSSCFKQAEYTNFRKVDRTPIYL